MLFLMAGTQMQMLAQGYLAYEITGSGTILGFINLGIAVPLLTVPLFGGALADKIDRKLLIQGAQLTAALLALVLGVMIDTEVIAWQHLMISSMVQGALFSFMMPARQAIIPQLVGQNRLSNAMALNARRHERDVHGGARPGPASCTTGPEHGTSTTSSRR